jgi:hypothetical protein
MGGPRARCDLKQDGVARYMTLSDDRPGKKSKRKARVNNKHI